MSMFVWLDYSERELRVSSVLMPVQAGWADEPSPEEALEYERLAMDGLEAPSIAANLREAYRRFYTGTGVGRLMALRSDRRMYHVKPEDLGIEQIIVLLHRRISFVGMVLGGLLATIAVELFLHH